MKYKIKDFNCTTKRLILKMSVLRHLSYYLDADEVKSIFPTPKWNYRESHFSQEVNVGTGIIFVFKKNIRLSFHVWKKQIDTRDEWKRIYFMKCWTPFVRSKTRFIGEV